MKMLSRILRLKFLKETKEDRKRGVNCHYCDSEVELTPEVAHVLIACHNCKKEPLNILTQINEYTV